ncbi:alpha-2B adrenergic receptor-like [Ischnura elegans]|uniref:alpha-2B adrenergic receptor-like n=1 Tax=Ischnura elegans TaxID=197161 RepID=UPI001ED889D8|nr:alpha-2B adrenergic receptor-like [Ischnura elegans]
MERRVGIEVMKGGRGAGGGSKQELGFRGQLSEDIGYVLYSALGSFYIPSCIMVFVYIRIYFAAKARARRGIRKRPKPTAPTAQQQKNTMEMATIVAHRAPGGGDGPPGAGGKHVRLSTSLSAPNNPPPVIISIPVVTCDYASDMSTSDQGGGGGGDAGNGLYLEAPASGTVLTQGSIKASRPDQDHPMASPFRDSTLSVNGDVQGRRAKGEESNGGATAAVSSTSSSSAKGSSSTTAALCVPAVIETDMVSEFDPSSSDSGVVSRCAVVKPLKLRLCQPIFGRRSAAALGGAASSKAKREVVDTGRRLSTQGPADGDPANRGRKDSLKGGLTPKSVMASTDAISTASADGVEEVGGGSGRGGRNRPGGGHHHAAPAPKPRDPEREKRRIARKKEKRATLILGLIMGSFIACWLPFFFLYILTPMCPVCHIPGSAFSTAFWLGYMNSALNPVIYTIFNKDFRRAFRRILFK